MDFNIEDNFDILVNENLGSYVYILQDPRDGTIFYIGKAGGKLSQGNQRIQDHFKDARKYKYNILTKKPSAKVAKILEIWEAKSPVKWSIVRRNLRDEQEAFNVEAALIDLIKISNLPPLLNIQNGHGTGNHGMLDSDGIKSLLARSFGYGVIPNDVIGRNIILFNIKNALKNASNSNDPYQAARKSWGFGPKIRKSQGTIAIALVDGISHGAWEIDSWKISEDNPAKWEFLKKDLNSELIDFFTWKNYSNITSLTGYWNQGNPIAFKINKNCEIIFTHGSKNKDNWIKI